MEIVKLSADGSASDVVKHAGRVLSEGGLVAFPTETVYGLGANAANRDAMQRLRAVKQRSADKPFTVMIASRDQTARYVGRVSPTAARLARKGWPGPLTLVFELDGQEPPPLAKEMPADLQAGIYHEGTVGLRCPALPFTRDMLSTVPDPVVVTSANQAAKPAPTDADGVVRGLEGLIDLLIDGGEVRFGTPSTIVKVAGDRLTVLRSGVLDERTIRRMATWTVLFVCTGNTCRSPMAEGICRKLLAEKFGCREADLADRGIRVASAGVGAGVGHPPSEEAVAACESRGIDISGLRSRPLSVENINAADVIFCMTESHRESVVAYAPTAADKTLCLDPDGGIEDPAGGTAQEYERTAAKIESLLRDKLKEFEI